MTIAGPHRSGRRLVFTATPGPECHRFWTPASDHSRLHWLPVLGPTSWLLWGTVTSRLEASDESIAVGADTLAVELGLGRPDRLLKALERLEHFGLAQRTDDGTWTILTAAPTAPSRAASPRLTRTDFDRQSESGTGADGRVVDSLRIATPPVDPATRALGARR